MQVASHTRVFVFEDFSLDPSHRLLIRGDNPVALHPKALELLLTLIENRDRVLTKTELLNTIWEGQFVEENNLAVQISALRKIFGERSGENRYIVTVPGRGYQFVASVRTANHQVPVPASDTSAATNGLAPTTELPDRDLQDLPRQRTGKAALTYLACGALLTIVLAAAAYLIWWNRDPSSSIQWKFIKQTTSGNVTNATLSRDGKFIVFSQTEGAGESLWLRQIDTGSQTRIIPPEAVDYVGLSISPDNNFIYFSTFAANRASTPLQRIPLLGGVLQPLSMIESGVAVSFSPDGRFFVFTEASSSLRESYLKIAAADGTDPRTLVRAQDSERIIQDHKMRPASWSPGGTEIAVAIGYRTSNGLKTGILLVDPNDGTSRVALEPEFASIHSLVWLDAENLAFVAAGFDKPTGQIWTLSTKSAHLTRVTNDLQGYLWISARSGGDLLTVQNNSVSRLNIAPFDDKVHTLRPREMLQETELNSVAFTLDGDILYTSRASGTCEIWRVSPNGGDPKQITVDARVRKGFAVSPRDGSLVFSSNRGGRPALWAADAEGKNLRPLTDGEDVFPQFAPDGRSIVFQRGSVDFPTVWRVGTDVGSAPIQLVRQHSVIPIVSPNGSQIAFYFMDLKADGAWRVGIVSADTGELISKLSFPVPVSERRMSWHPSGTFLGQIVDNGDTVSLLLLPTDGGKAQVISRLGHGRVNSFGWSTDGKTLVYSLTAETQDAVLLTKLLRY